MVDGMVCVVEIAVSDWEEEDGARRGVFYMRGEVADWMTAPRVDRVVSRIRD